LKVYLSVPMILNRRLGRANLIAKAIRDSGHEVVSDWVLGPLERQSPSELNVFERDMKGAERSDALVADVSEPSLGVGMEIMAAYKAGRKIILVSNKGRVVSRMLLHMDGALWVEYEGEDELYGKLVEAFRGLR